MTEVTLPQPGELAILAGAGISLVKPSNLLDGKSSSVIRRRDLLVIGYSGWDDLDIVPVLGDTGTTRRLIWIDHVTNGPALQ
jgi:hypothetical protein